MGFVEQLFSLCDRVAIVTGTSGRLGAALAKALSHAGARLVVTGRNAEAIEHLAAELPRCVGVVADLSTPDAAAELIEVAHTAYGPVEVVVNVAGTLCEVVPAQYEDPATLGRTIDINLQAAFSLMRHVYPDMRKLGRGSIVNVSSISSLVGIDGIPQASYAASKAALNGLTRELAVQWGRHGIRVNALAPGFFESAMTGPLYEAGPRSDWRESSTPLAYRGTAEDLAGAVLWLASDAGRFVTGQVVVVDGGWTAR